MSDKNILDCNETEANEFFSRSSSFCNIDLPQYFDFTPVLSRINKEIAEKELRSFCKSMPKDFSGVNYKIYSNKDGKYAWRPLELINPVLYINLVNLITEKDNWDKIKNRLTKFQVNPKIKCVSMPIVASRENAEKEEQILSWWENYEQVSIEKSLDYSYMFETDVTDCYGSIYTHAIAWAIETLKIAKESKGKGNLLGDRIDFCIREMRYGQTNGIPQGSILMDFIAEIVLGYADLRLSKKITNEEINDFYILRYRDDYRIFVNNPQDGEKIIKHLTEVLASLGMKINVSKTKTQSDIITHSIKADKLAWIKKTSSGKSLQKQLYFIHDHATAYPNSGSLIRALSNFKELLRKTEVQKNELIPMIAIVVDIAYKNPKTYAMCAAILSILLTDIKTKDEKQNVINKILKRFLQIPNTGHLEIWLQRITLTFDKERSYEEKLCRLISGETVQLWEYGWLNEGSSLGKFVQDTSKMVNNKALSKISPEIQAEEVDIFLDYYSRK